MGGNINGIATDTAVDPVVVLVLVVLIVDTSIVVVAY